MPTSMPSTALSAAASTFQSVASRPRIADSYGARQWARLRSGRRRGEPGGLGRSLIDAFVRQLHGELKITSDQGTQLQVKFRAPLHRASRSQR